MKTVKWLEVYYDGKDLLTLCRICLHRLIGQRSGSVV